MSVEFLHGIEVKDSESGLREIAVSSTSVIGLIGTAPEADADIFPLNKPVLVNGKIAAANGLGQTGTLPVSLKGVFDQASAKVVVIRVEESTNEDPVEALNETKLNVIGASDVDGSLSGVHAFLGAKTVTGYEPKILIAPQYSSDLAVSTELLTIANRLKSVVVADAPDEEVAAKEFAASPAIASDRMYVIYPKVILSDGAARSASPYVAGIIAQTDSQIGFWASPSNKVISGIVGITKQIDYSHGDAACKANILNEGNITTIINYDGYRVWGNRTTVGDTSPMKFLCVRRTADAINEAILRSHMWAVDRNIVKNYLTEVTEGVNAFLRGLKTQGAILYGKCVVNQDLTTAENVMNGKVYFDFEFTPVYCAEHITFTSYLNNDKIEEVLFENLAV